jgi:uncharacterized Zn finger protein
MPEPDPAVHFPRGFPRGRPRPVEGGLKARSQRGEIGESWWSQHFLEILRAFGFGTRLARGRSYARRGQVLGLSVGAGVVEAQVQGSRARPYRVRLAVQPLTEADWDRAERAMASRAVFLARLLAGEMPMEIEQAFAECRLSLFPGSGDELASACSCPDWANPCKHVAAAFYLLAEAFDEDPFLVFRWRGRTKQELIEHLRALRGGAAGERDAAPEPAELGEPPLSARLDSYWQAGAGLAGLELRPVAPEVPEALVRQLGPAPVTVPGQDLGQVLAAAYRAMSSAAERLALGEPSGPEG